MFQSTGRAQNNTQELYDKVYRDPKFSNQDMEARQRMRYLWQFDNIRDKLQNAQSFIDIGGGPGGASHMLYLYLNKPKDKSFTILDFSLAAKRGFDFMGYESYGFEFIKKTFLNYRFKKTYDVIMCFEMLEHVTDIFATLNKLWSILKDGGLFIGSFPHGGLCECDTHLWRADHNELFHSLEQVWQVPITFYPWTKRWRHIYFSAEKRNEVNSPITDWRTDIKETMEKLT